MARMTSLSIGVSALQASQNAINTTAHNLSNVGTKGYVRQQVEFADTAYLTLNVGANVTNQIGIGVDLADVRRVRDYFLDKAYRQETGRQSFYENQKEAITEIEEIFGELEGVSFQKYMEDLWATVQEVAKDPSSTVNKSALVESATSFIVRADAVRTGLINYQNTLNTKIVNMVDRINVLGDQIKFLNGKISMVEAAGVESANDLRDERDNALDELSGLVKFSYEENKVGLVTISIEGVPFVTETGVNHMSAKQLDGTNDSELVTPVWEYLDDAKVYNLQVPVYTSKNTDIGGLKGVLLARGNSIADYKDIPDKNQFTDATGAFIDTDAEAAYNAELDEYRRLVEPSSIKTVMAEFDLLINGIVEGINDILAPNVNALGEGVVGPLEDADGNIILIDADTLILDTKNAGYGSDDYKTQGTELFTRNHTKRYIECSDGSNTYYVYNKLNEFGADSLYSLGNIRVNTLIEQNPALLPLVTVEGEEDMARAAELADLWDKALLKLTPDHVSPRDFVDFYTDLIGQVSDAGKMYDSMVDYQTSMAADVDAERLRISGVSSDEELTNLIRFQSAYNAASRYITVIDQMLEHIVTRL